MFFRATCVNHGSSNLWVGDFGGDKQSIIMWTVQIFQILFGECDQPMVHHKGWFCHHFGWLRYTVHLAYLGRLSVMAYEGSFSGCFISRGSMDGMYNQITPMFRDVVWAVVNINIYSNYNSRVVMSWSESVGCSSSLNLDPQHWMTHPKPIFHGGEIPFSECDTYCRDPKLYTF